MVPDRLRLPVSLLSLRVGVFVVMIMWSVDKILNPGHAGAVFENFYMLEGMGGTALAVMGGLQVLVVLAFVAGLFRSWTYGLVLLMHLVSTLSSWKMYLGFDNLLFFAAWPMLAACIALFLLRRDDNLFSLVAVLAKR